MDNALHDIARLLLEHRETEDDFWPYLTVGQQPSKSDANRFFAGAILGYQIPFADAWKNGRRMCEDLIGDPENVWSLIARIPQPEWNERWRDYALHRFPKAHESPPYCGRPD